MDVHLGPVSSSSVRSWVAYATGILSGENDAMAPSVDPGAVDEFLGYLRTWDDLAATGPDTFVWEGSIEPERLEYLAHSFARIVDHLWAVAATNPALMPPPEGEDFYQALVLAIIAALEHQGDAAGEFSEQLRDSWPGLRRR